MPEAGSPLPLSPAAQDLRPAEARTAVADSVGEVLARFPQGVPLLDPEEDMKIQDPAYRKLARCPSRPTRV